MARDLQTKDKTLDPNLYVYRQARDVSKTQVDWANLTNELTKDLATIRETREQTRQDAIDANRKLLNELDNLDPYAHETANTKIQQAAHDASQLLMTDFSLVVNGEKKLKDYKQTEQLLSDNFNSLKGAMDTYVEHFDIAMERANNDEANIGEIFNNESLAGFGSLSALNIVVQPSGAIGLVKKQFDADGNEIEVDLTNPENIMSLTHVNDRVQYKADYIDPNETAQKTVNTLGAFITGQFLDLQKVQTLEDFRQMTYTDDNGEQRSGFDVISSMADELAVTDNQKLSILQLAGFTSDDITQDPKVAEEQGKILQIPNKNGSGMMGYEFNEQHEKIIRDQSLMIVERQIDSKMAFEKGVQKTYKPQKNQVGYTEDVLEATADNYLSLVDGILTGDATTAEANAASLVDILNRNPGKGDQAARVTSIEKKVNADGSVDVVISREGLADKIISSSGDKTTDNASAEFYNSINTTSIGYESARKDRGAISSDYGLDAISYTAPEKTVDIEAPNLFTPLSTDSDGTSLMMVDYIANAMDTGSKTKTTKVTDSNIDTGAMEDSIDLLLDKYPGLKDEIDKQGGVNVEFRKDSKGVERMYIDIPGSNSYSWPTTASTSARMVTETVDKMLENSANTFSEGKPGSKILGGE